MAKKKVVFDLVDRDESCIKHMGKVLDVYCVDHEEICCVICLATAHKKFKNIFTFEEMVSGSGEIKVVQQFADSLNEIEKNMDDLRTIMEESLALMDRRHGEFSRKVSATVEITKGQLDRFLSNFLTEFAEKHYFESSELQSINVKIKDFQNDLKKGQQILQTAREEKSPKLVLLTKEKIKMSMERKMERLKLDLKDAHCVEYFLKIDDILKSVLNSLRSVAEINVKPTIDLSTKLDELDGYCNNDEELNTLIYDMLVFKRNGINPIGEITGGAVFPDGRILICCHNKKSLQVYDEIGYFLIEKTRVCKYPVDACVMSSSEILVSFYNSELLRKYEIKQNSLKETGKIPCRSQPWGLATLETYIIVGYSREIDVMSINGVISLRFSRRYDPLSYVAVSISGHMFYTDDNYIVCTTLDGNEIRRFTHPDVQRLTGIAIDVYENVYVCDYTSNNLLLFSPDGQTSKNLGPVDNPYVIF